MSYAVLLYHNTGFNAVNLPESVGVLASSATSMTEGGSIDVIAPWDLTEVTITASPDDVYDVDYIKVGDYYYAAGRAHFSSANICTFPVTLDGFLSAGGIGNLDFLDGITDRVCVKDDSMFKYPEADAYTAPAQPLAVSDPYLAFMGTATDSNSDVVVESTMDLTAIGAQFDDSGNFTGEAYTFTDSAGNEVTTPKTPVVSGQTTYSINGVSGTDEYVKAPNTRQYLASSATIQHALSVVQSLGVTGGIISEVVYPKTFVNVVSPSSGDPHVQRVEGLVKDVSVASLPFDYYSTAGYTYTPKNNKTKYGQYNKYVLVTAAGDEADYLPEEIGIATAGGAAMTAPSIMMIADPRPTGKPYFRSKVYQYAEATADNNYRTFWRGCLAGIPWSNAPLVYQGAAGSYQTRFTYDNTRGREVNDYLHETSTADLTRDRQNSNAGLSAGGGLLSGMLSMLSGNGAGAGISSLMGATGALTGDIYDARQYYNDRSYRDAQYTLERNKELQQFAVSQSVYVPTVQFPFNANVLRDFVGNGCFMYRYYYTEQDLERVDKILTAFGYKHTKKLERSDFYGRQYFNYVSATGVTVKAADGAVLPRWLRDTIGTQLTAGVRIWHTKPTTDAYAENPIATT